MCSFLDHGSSMKILRLKKIPLFRSSASLCSLAVILVISISIALAMSLTKSKAPNSLTAKHISTVKTTAPAKLQPHTASSVVNATQPTTASSSQTTNARPTAPAVTVTPSAPKTKPSQGLTCPYANMPSNEGYIGNVPPGIYAPEGSDIVAGSTSSIISISTASNEAVSWIPQTGLGSPVYITSKSAPGVTSPTYAFQLVAQPNAVLGKVYWVYINIVFPNNTTATYSLPVSIVCY